MAWFVVYEDRKLGAKTPRPSNVILRKTHPVVWAAQGPKAYREVGYLTYLLFFAEIPDAVLDEAAGHFSILD